MQTKFFSVLMLIATMSISCGKDKAFYKDGNKYDKYEDKDKCGDKEDWGHKGDYNGSSKEEKEDKSCFKFVYPIYIKQTSGTTQTITTEEELKAAWDNCEHPTNNSVTNNKRSKEVKCFEFVYPIIVKFNGKVTKELSNDKELDMAFESCAKKGKDGYKKVTKAIVKIDGCQYITAGTVEYYNNDKELTATIDFGDGTCDNIATKTTPDGTVYTIEADYWK